MFCQHSLILLALLSFMALDALPSCNDGEFHYEYTECGSDGGRWHVAVPHDPAHCRVMDKAPIRQKSCESGCPGGQFLDVSTLKEQCKACPIGTHSLGSSVRYDNWTIMPSEFDSYSTKEYSEFQPNENDPTCNATWIADGYFLRTVGSSCIARLTYSTTIVQNEGSLTFSYYFSNKAGNIYFETYVQNEECRIAKQDNQNDEDDDDDNDGYDDYRALKPTKNFQLANFTLTLKRGKNLVVWEVEDWHPSRGSGFADLVFIKDIEVKGVSFSSECAPCPAGYYAAKEGSSWCHPCPENQISTGGASKCTPCKQDTEYAPKGSSKCISRVPCKETDYFETSSSCDKNNKFETVYKWIEPKICNHVTSGAVKLPQPGPAKKDCPPCNSGMYLNVSQCIFCPPGTFGDGVKACQPCPASTAPVMGYNIKHWRDIPSTFDHWCYPSRSCVTPEGWQLRGDFLDSGYGHKDNARLYMEIETGGFVGATTLTTGSTLGMFRIDFELDCDGSCVLYLYEIRQNQPREMISTWTGRHARQNYTYAVTSKHSQSFFLKFIKTSESDYWKTHGKMIRYIKDRMKIYSIVVTNTVGGGAGECRKCPAGLHETGCVECPEGHYIDKTSKKCQPCASGTYMNNNTCIPCSHGLTSTKASSHCYSNCHYHSKDGRHVDLSSLDGTHLLQTRKTFMTGGTPYFYEYHISLCGNKPARCHTNASFSDSHTIVREHLNTSICQMRIVTEKKKGRSVSADMIGIGHQLMTIYDQKPTNLSLDVFKNDKLVNDSLLYFEFWSHTVTRSCRKGRSAWVLLKCDLGASGKGSITVPPKCMEGTCDGCQFLFLWRTRYACSVCTKEHYSRLESGCMHRKRAIHYSWNTTLKDCVDGVSLPALEHEVCEEMTVHEAVKRYPILIGIVAFVVTGILASIVFLWYKYSVLTYKLYQRVSVNDNDQGGELPGAPTCVADEDGGDEPDERIEFRRGANPGKKLMKKLTDFSKKSEENMHLGESFEVDLS